MLFVAEPASKTFTTSCAAVYAYRPDYGSIYVYVYIHICPCVVCGLCHLAVRATAERGPLCVHTSVCHTCAYVTLAHLHEHLCAHQQTFSSRRCMHTLRPIVLHHTYASAMCMYTYVCRCIPCCCTGYL